MNSNENQAEAVNGNLGVRTPTAQATTVTHSPPNYTSYQVPVYREQRREKMPPNVQPSVISGLDYLRSTKEVTTAHVDRHTSLKFTVVSSMWAQQQRRGFSPDDGFTSGRHSVPGDPNLNSANLITPGESQFERRNNSGANSMEQYNASGYQNHNSAAIVAGESQLKSRSNLSHDSENMEVAEDPQQGNVSQPSRAAWEPRSREERPNTYLR